MLSWKMLNGVLQKLQEMHLKSTRFFEYLLVTFDCLTPVVFVLKTLIQ